MKSSSLVFLIVACVLVLVDVEGQSRKRIVKYIQPAAISVPPPYSDFQSTLEDNRVTRNAGSSYTSPHTAQHPSLSCLLFSDDGCKASCGLICDINGCRQSDGFCIQKLYCVCNEVYVVKKQPVTADEFKSLAFDDLWNYKFKPTKNSANLKNRILQNDDLYRYVMPLLQNPHKSGRDVKEALQKQDPKLSSVQNWQPRERGVKAELFSEGADALGEHLHRYIQNMMNSVRQKPVYNRLNHTRYMRRIINLIKGIDNEEDLSYILRQIKQTGNDRLFQRLRRYLMKRGYYFDDDLRPISKKAALRMKKKGRCGCKRKFKPKSKRFCCGNSATSVNYGDDDSDWMEGDDEEEQIERALIEQLFDSNDSETKYPSNDIIDEQPMPNPNYPITLDDEPALLSQDTNIVIPPNLEEAVEAAPKNMIQFNRNQMIPPNDTQYVITPNAGGPAYPTMTSQQPTVYLQESNYPEYSTFVSNPNGNQVYNKPMPEFTSNTFTNYGNQQIPTSSMVPETIYHKEFVQPNNGILQNIPYLPKSFVNSQYFSTPGSTFFTMSQNPLKPDISTMIQQYPELFNQQIITPARKFDEYPKPTIVPQNLEKASETIIIPPMQTSNNVDQSPQRVTTQSEILEGPSNLPIESQIIEQSPQPIIPLTEDLGTPAMPLVTPQTTQKIFESSTPPIQDNFKNLSNPSTLSQNLHNLTPTITQNVINPPELIASPQTIENSSQTITSPPQNLLQQFVTEKPLPNISDSSPYLDQSPASPDMNTPQNLLHQFATEKSLPNIPDSSPYLNKLPASPDMNTYDIPDAVPSMKSSFVKHNQSPDQISTTTMSSPGISSSFSSPLNSPVVTNNFESPITLQSYEIHSPPVMQKPLDKVYYQVLMDENGNIIKSANYKYPGQPQYSQNMQQFTSALPPQYSSTTYQDDQPLFDKFDRQMILDAAKLKPGQSTVLDNDLNTSHDIPVFDIPSEIDMLSRQFGVSPDDIVIERDATGRDTLETMPISYNTNDEVNATPGGQEYTYEINGDNSYNIPINSEVMRSTNEWPGPTPAGSQYTYEIIRDNNHNIPINPQVMGSIKEWQSSASPGSPYAHEIDRTNTYDIPINSEVTILSEQQPGASHHSFEIDKDNREIHTNPRLTLDYEENNLWGVDNWSSNSIDDSDNNILLSNAIRQNKIPNNIILPSENDGIVKSSKGSFSTIVETSSQSSTNITNNNSIPIQLTSHVDNNTSEDTEVEVDYENYDDILVNPEDDLINY